MVAKIAAGIVLYNPENMERLEKCLNSISLQIDKIYIYDNSTTKYSFDFSEDITYITQNQNMGIAYALNQIMEAASADGYTWVITMDQDSILPPDTIKEYRLQAEHGEQLGIICPQVIDSRRKYMIPKTEPQKEFVEFCITSASCTSIKVWRKLGGFDERLFIDLVDNDFCKRLICSGYKILKINTLILDQEFGKIIPKSPRTQRFWILMSKIFHNNNIAKFSYYKFVNPMRVYYTNRNIIYVNRKLKNYGSVAYQENYNCKGYLGFWVSFNMPSFLRAQNKWAVLKAIATGIHGGRKMPVKKWEKE